jgi:O-antigen/teichoic acid export membrane protein
VAAGFQAIEKMRFLAYASVLGRLIATVAGIVLVMVGVRAIGLLLLGVVVWALIGGLTVLWARPYFHIALRVTRRELRSLFIHSLPYWGFVAFFTIYLWIDSLMLAAMTTTTVLGWYGLPTQLFGTLMFVPTILSTAWLSRLVRAHQGGMDTLLRAARPAIEIALVLSMPVCVGAVLISDHLVATLYGPSFAQSGPILALLACCVPPMYLNIMANQVMIARNQQIVWTKMMALASVINPLLNLVLIPYFQRTHGDGAIGAAIAMIVTEVVLALIGFFLVRDVFTRQTAVRVLKGAAATAAMAGIVVAGLRVGLVVGVLSGMVSFPLLAVAARVLTKDERAHLLGLLGGALREVAPRRRPRFGRRDRGGVDGGRGGNAV